MVKLADEFSLLSPDFKKVLQVAQETQNIKVTPLSELKGGQTGANLFLVSISSLHSGKLQHLVLKLDRKSPKTQSDELERHRTAVSEASAEFARDHIPELSFDRIELDNSVAIFYNIAGQSLHNYRPLASYQQQNRIEKIFRTTNDVLLRKWNANPSYQQAVHPQKVLSSWLGYRLKPGGNIEQFLENTCQVNPGTAGLFIQGNVYLNPLLYARRDDLWGNIRPIDIILGFQHGDLNLGNILVRFDGEKETIKGYYLIDFALFKPDMPLFYDNLYVQMSYLIRELSRVEFPRWIDLVNRFSENDIPDVNRVPVELAGATAVINAARTEFFKWVNKFHSSLSDDLWGQYWLAAVAVGLNFCNKTVISDIERMAGLIFAAAHLKRYQQVFGVTLPREVAHINVTGLQAGTLQTGKSGKSGSAPNKMILPDQNTLFIGRGKEMHALAEFFDREEVRLVTLTGPGEQGKHGWPCSWR